MTITQQDRDDFRDSLTDEERNDFDTVQFNLEDFKLRLQDNPELEETEWNKAGDIWDERFLKWMETK